MKKSPRLSSLIDKAVFDYHLIEKGDRILIGASGGKDSTALIKYFVDRAGQTAILSIKLYLSKVILRRIFLRGLWTSFSNGAFLSNSLM